VICTLIILGHIFTFKHLCLHSITKILRNGPKAHFPFSLTTLGAVPAVPATLPRPRGSVSRPPGGRPGASAVTRHPRAAQTHASLGRAVRHRQGSEARNIQAGQQSRQGLRQRLEHPTATSLLPLRCFQVARIPRSHTESGRQRRG
jgi:hypothetical protein